ncbi:hypothetical protein HPB47_016700, partial [Ixodes persulcatus]
VDEPLLSGTGDVSKDCSEGELEGWAQVLAKWRQVGLGPDAAPKALGPLVRAHGIPEALRGEVWQLLAGAAQDPGAAQAYRLLLARDCPCEGVIQRDVHRTFPAHDFFRESGGAGQDSLYKICKVCDNIRHKFLLENVTFNNAEVAHLKLVGNASFGSVFFFIEAFPRLLPLLNNESRDNAWDALEVEFAELQAHGVSGRLLNEERCGVRSSEVGRIANIDGRLRFGRVAKRIRQIVVIPFGNAECERIFSAVKKTNTFRFSLSNKTLGDLFMVKGYQSGQCYEQAYLEKFLRLAKSATAKSPKTVKQ